MPDQSIGMYSQVDTEENIHHWSPESQTYAPVDVLMTYLRKGWTLSPLAAIETHYYAGYRRVDVYYFTLTYIDQRIEIPVLGNPIVTRLLGEKKITVVRLSSLNAEVD